MNNSGDTMLLLQKQITGIRAKNLVQESIIRTILSTYPPELKNDLLASVKRAFSNTPTDSNKEKEEFAKECLNYLELFSQKR